MAHTTAASREFQETDAPEAEVSNSRPHHPLRASSAHASPSAAHAPCPPCLATLPCAPLREEAWRHEGAEAGGEGDGVRGDPARQRRRGCSAGDVRDEARRSGAAASAQQQHGSEEQRAVPFHRAVRAQRAVERRGGALGGGAKPPSGTVGVCGQRGGCVPAAACAARITQRHDVASAVVCQRGRSVAAGGRAQLDARKAVGGAPG